MAAYTLIINDLFTIKLGKVGHSLEIKHHLFRSQRFLLSLFEHRANNLHGPYFYFYNFPEIFFFSLHIFIHFKSDIIMNLLES